MFNKRQRLRLKHSRCLWFDHICKDNSSYLAYHLSLGLQQASLIIQCDRLVNKWAEIVIIYWPNLWKIRFIFYKFIRLLGRGLSTYWDNRRSKYSSGFRCQYPKLLLSFPGVGDRMIPEVEKPQFRRRQKRRPSEPSETEARRLPSAPPAPLLSNVFLFVTDASGKWARLFALNSLEEDKRSFPKTGIG